MKQTYKHYKNKRNFFEGYFIKCSNLNEQVAIIPSFEVSSNGDVCAGIQILTSDFSIYKSFETKNFDSTRGCFDVYIGENTFNATGVNINFETGKHKISGNLKFGDFNPLKSSIYAPTIMGPFSYFKFLDCYHFVISTNHLVTGKITVDDKTYNFTNDNCYIEGDYGRSFPKEWFFAQGNSFTNKDASFMVAIAKLNKPKILGNLGFIRDKKSGLDLRLGTYYCTKLKSFTKTPKGHKLKLYHKDYTIYIETVVENSEHLLSPRNGKLSKIISEATIGTAKVQVFKRDKLIFSDTSNNISSESNLSTQGLCL